MAGLDSVELILRDIPIIDLAFILVQVFYFGEEGINARAGILYLVQL